MCLGGIAVLAHIQIQHHGIIGIGNGRRMPPGVLRIEHQMVLGCGIELRILLLNCSIQPLTELIAVTGILVMLHGVRRTANPIGPPVVPVPLVHRSILQLGADGCVQLL